MQLGYGSQGKVAVRALLLLQPLTSLPPQGRESVPRAHLLECETVGETCFSGRLPAACQHWAALETEHAVACAAAGDRRAGGLRRRGSQQGTVAATQQILGTFLGIF